MEQAIRKAAHELTIKFADELDIPARFKNNDEETKKIRKAKPDAKIEIRFKEHVNSWIKVIKDILEGTESHEQAWDYIRINPKIEVEIKSVTQCQDFLNFTDLLIEKREKENYNDEELGKLCMLHHAFQEEIERKINTTSVSVDIIRLKNEEAQRLREKGKIVIDGIEINLWQGHSFASVSTQETWNKIKSYTFLNSLSDGENGHIVITGVLQIPRQEAAEYATKLGFKVHSNPSKTTNIIVIGSENVSPSKIAKAIELNKNGAEIKFMDELTFLSMMAENI